jgi:hypothetical protein
MNTKQNSDGWSWTYGTANIWRREIRDSGRSEQASIYVRTTFCAVVSDGVRCVTKTQLNLSARMALMTKRSIAMMNR